jgi:hypothetical protein
VLEFHQRAFHLRAWDAAMTDWKKAADEAWSNSSWKEAAVQYHTTRGDDAKAAAKPNGKAPNAEDWIAEFAKKSNEALAAKSAEKQISPAPDERAVVAALARKDHTEYDRVRSEVAETLGIRVGTHSTIRSKRFAYRHPLSHSLRLVTRVHGSLLGYEISLIMRRLSIKLP